MPERTAMLSCVLLLLASPAFGQKIFPIPFELSAGMGVVNDRSSSRSAPAIVGGWSWDYDADWWLVPIFEGELNKASRTEACRRPSADSSGNCDDGIWLLGARFRQAPRDISGVRPFATFLLGKYLDASGTDERAFDGSSFAMQAGGGVEIRWPGSFQGVRISADLRRLSRDNRTRHQFRVHSSYVIGPRRYKRRQ